MQAHPHHSIQMPQELQTGQQVRLSLAANRAPKTFSRHPHRRDQRATYNVKICHLKVPLWYKNLRLDLNPKKEGGGGT